MTSLSVCQRVRINGVEGNRPLLWDDFTGKPDKNTSIFAYTYWKIEYKTKSVTYKDDTLVWDMEVWAELGKDSWVNKEKKTDTLLDHERGHFDIGKLCAMEIEAKIKSTVLLKNNYQQIVSSIGKEMGDKYRNMERLYDKETEHSRNRPEQWKWNVFLKKELDIISRK